MSSTLAHFFSQLLYRLGRPLWRQATFVVFMAALSVVSFRIVGRPHHQMVHYLLCWALDIYVLALCVDAFPRRISRWLQVLLFVVAYTLSAVEVFLFLRFNLLVSPTVLTLMAETSGEESSEFLSGMVRSNAFWQTVGIYVPMLALQLAVSCGWLRRAVVRLRRLCAHQGASSARPAPQSAPSAPSRGLRRGATVVAVVLLVTAAPHWWEEKQALWQFVTNCQSRDAERVPEAHFFAPHYRLLQALHLVRMSQSEIETLKTTMDTARVDSVAPGTTDLVVVIGESYNKHHAGLYGYRKPTTPQLDRLRRQGELVVFDDVVTPWNLTSSAFKAFLSTHSADQPGTWADGVLFPLLFRRAGFKVAFVTNQFYKSVSQGSIDFNGSFFLNDPHLDSLCFDFRNNFRSRDDRSITHLLKDYTPGRRNLYLLHLWGQHMEYDRRFPPEQAHFRPEDYDRPDLSGVQRQIVADYDNATRYNDAVLARILRYFRRRDAVIIYFADHGEEVYDDGVNCYGRIHSDTPSPAVIRHEYEVPFLIWGSPTFRQRHPAEAARIRAARHRPFSHDDLPHLLLGLAGIATSHYDRTRDPLSDDFVPHKRWLRGRKIDYDQSLRPKTHSCSTNKTPAH